MRFLQLALLVGALALAAVATGSGSSLASSLAPSSASPLVCPQSQSGPGPGRPSSTGALCLLKAFRSCQPAVYRLQEFGVDTVTRLELRVTKRGSGCVLRYRRSFRVVPQPEHILQGSCRSVVARRGAILAVGCSGIGDLTLSSSR